MTELGVRDAIRQLGLQGVEQGGFRQCLTLSKTHSARELIDKALRVKQLPPRLQFRLRYFAENESNDDTLQGPNDEVYMSAIGTDSADTGIGPDGERTVLTITAERIGDVSANSMREPWKVNPHVFLEFDLTKPSDWPRSFTVTLLLVEHDNGDLEKAFASLEEEVGTAVKATVVAASVTAGVAVGATIGSFVPIPGIGTAAGAAVGAIAAVAYNEVISRIKNGLGDDAFTPRTIVLLINEPDQIRNHPNIGMPQGLVIEELDGSYGLEYDWHLVDA